MAQFAVQDTVATSATEITPPTQADAFVRIRNLSSSNYIVIAIKPGVTATNPAGDEMVYLRAGENYLARRLATYSMIANTASVDVELEASQGRA